MKYLCQLTKKEISKIMSEDPKHEYQKGPFIQISHKLLENKKFLGEFFYTKKSRLYFFLRQHIVRGPNSGSDLEIYYSYWKNNLLAATIAIPRLCKKLEMPETTLRDQINRLEEDGLIIIDRFDGSEFPDHKPQHVFTLGIRKDGIERYFIDDVFLQNVKPEVPDDDD